MSGAFEAHAEVNRLTGHLDQLGDELKSVNDRIERKGSTRGLRDRAAKLTRELETTHSQIDEAKSRWERGIRSNQYHREGGAPGMRASNDRGPELKLGKWLKNSLERKAVADGWQDFSGANQDAYAPVEYSSTAMDFLADQSVVMESGVQRINTGSKKLIVPHLTSDPNSAFYAEASDMSWTHGAAQELEAVPKRISALTSLTTELLDDSDPNALQQLSKSLLRSVALKFDATALEGSVTADTNSFNGLLYTSGIQTVSMGTDGAAFTNLDPVAEAIGKLLEENAEAGAIVMSARTWRDLSKLKADSTDSNKPLVSEYSGAPTDRQKRELYGVPVFISNQLAEDREVGESSDCTNVYVFDKEEVHVVHRQAAEVEEDRSLLFRSHQVALRCSFRATLLVPNPKSVAVINGVRPSSAA